MALMKIQRLRLLAVIIISVLSLSACQPKKPAEQPMPVNQQITADLPKVEMKPVITEDPSTYPPENFIALSGSDGKKNGDAYRTYLQNKFIVKIGVTLPNLNAGDQYSAYLVNPSSKKFIPLGNLTQKEDKWAADTSSDRDGKEFTHLVIVSGKNIIDPDKGRVVASGDFKN